MPLALGDYFCGPSDQHIGQPLPVFVVSIDDERNQRIFGDVSQPSEPLRRDLFRFFIDGGEKLLAVKNETDRDDVGLIGGIGCGEVGDAGGTYKTRSARREA